MKVNVKKLHPDAVIPKYAKDGDAGLDLVAIDDGTMKVELVDDVPGEHGPQRRAEYRQYKIGLAFEIPKGYVGLIFPRSSITKYGFMLKNCVGVIDSGYRGDISFRFQVMNDYPIRYKKGDKIGQMIIMPYPSIELNEVEELSDTERGEGGFGSSGK